MPFGTHGRHADRRERAELEAAEVSFKSPGSNVDGFMVTLHTGVALYTVLYERSYPRGQRVTRYVGHSPLNPKTDSTAEMLYGERNATILSSRNGWSTWTKCDGDLTNGIRCKQKPKAKPNLMPLPTPSHS
jgi:hypothetical protein